ncbi:MAG: pilus assembly protein [Sphingomonadaceae bacterium]|nr:pilus assembly protein [Sphingomonadaceae bacterium]
MRNSTRILSNQNGAAGAEMALMLPLLITLMFGTFELGNYFWSEHKVVKSVRDAARFASRQSEFYTPTNCTAGTVSSTVATNIDNIARYGKLSVTVADKPKIFGWTTPVTVSLSCPAIGSYVGIYKGKANVPVVTVTATGVPYPSLFKVLGFTSTGLTLNASSQSAVTGI